MDVSRRRNSTKPKANTRVVKQQSISIPPYKKLESGWIIHQIDNPQRAWSNGLDWADVNGDRLPDYLTNYEWSGLVRLSFHPGLEKVKSVDSWPSVDIGQIKNAESIVLSGFDGDGHVDGDEDIADLDSDWNTPYDAIKLVWCENPGAGKPE
jgi:hypothetical protein